MSSDALTIGVLTPRSTIYPALSANFLAGLRLALELPDGPLAGRPPRLLVEDSGFGQVSAEERVRKLLGWERADLVIGLLSVNVASALQPLFEAQQKLLIAANLGENIPRALEYHPLTFHHTLGLWQANWALGRWAAEQLGRRAIIAQTFYDSGYDLPFAFRDGFESAGGEVPFTFLSHVPPDRGNFAPLFAQIERHRPDFVFASACGPEAVQVVRAYGEAGLRGQIPLLGSGLLTDAPLLGEQGEAALGVRSARAWPDRPDTPAGHAFARAYQKQHAGQPDGPALLGFEVGRLVAHALADAGDAARQPARLRAALLAGALDGPRGRLAFDPQTQSALQPEVHLREVGRLDGALAHVPLARLAAPAEQDPRFDAVRNGMRSGWMNTYLSV